MMQYIIPGGQFLLGISILVVLHELGHFLTAKYFKTKVESFYLFFNPWFSIYKKKIGDTEYGIGWLPLGGYVKIAGMIDESMDKEQLAKDPEPWEFRSKPAWQRLIIMLGGVIVNVITAFVIYAMVLFVWGEKYIPATSVTSGVYCDSLMLNVGFQHNDQIIALDGINISDEITYGEIKQQLIFKNIKEVTVNRNNESANIEMPSDFSQTILEADRVRLLTVEVPYIVDSIVAGSSAEAAGIVKGDEVIAIDGEMIAGFNHSIDVMAGKKDVEVLFTVKRNGLKKDLTVKTDQDGKIGLYKKSPFDFLTFRTKEYEFFESIPAGFFKTGRQISSYLDQVKLIFSSTAGMGKLGGFGTIAKGYGEEWIWQRFWEFTAMLSVMLAVMNLLPIPALDGGHVMFLSYEIVTGRKPHEKVMEYAQVAGMLLLLTFMLYANGMDVVRAWF